MRTSPPRPVVLAIGGHDPTGGAGIQADIESISANGGRAVTLVTALTVQNSARFASCVPVEAADFQRAAAALIEDIEIAALKIGLVPNAALAIAIGEILADLPAIPVVLDPVLASGTGSNIADAQTAAALKSLLPHVTVATPNTEEALRLTGAAKPEAAANQLLEAGAANVLLTGTHADTTDVINALFQPTRTLRWSWPRLPYVYHGSGCTLAASLATLLALGWRFPPLARWRNLYLAMPR